LRLAGGPAARNRIYFGLRALAQIELVPVPRATSAARQLPKPHPNDEAEVGEASDTDDCGEVYGTGSDALLRWLDEIDDEPLREACIVTIRA